MKKQLTAIGTGALAWALPIAVLAQTQVDTGSGIGKILNTLGGLINFAMPIVVALALLAFFWGLAIYIFNFSGKDDDKKKGRDIMVYGVIVLFVMLSIWGIVNILRETFDLTSSQAITVPGLNVGSGGQGSTR